MKNILTCKILIKVIFLCVRIKNIINFISYSICYTATLDINRQADYTSKHIFTENNSINYCPFCNKLLRGLKKYFNINVSTLECILKSQILESIFNSISSSHRLNNIFYS